MTYKELLKAIKPFALDKKYQHEKVDVHLYNIDTEVIKHHHLDSVNDDGYLVIKIKAETPN